MIDRREEILARIRVILEEVPGVKRAARNREDVSGKDRPALIMHDAVEETADFPGRPRKTFSKDVMKLLPQIYILLGDRSEVVGSKVSELRSALVPLIWQDQQLKDLVGSNGFIRYMGCGLDTTTGETREARLELKFEFEYTLDAAELTG